MELPNELNVTDAIEETLPIIPKDDDKYVIVHFEGGLGKHVAGTAILEGVAKKYPDRKIILVCGYPEVFLWNPYCHRVYGLGNTPYFYYDYIKDKDSIILKAEPYSNTHHIHQRQHLIESWFEVFGLDYDGEVPKLYTPYRMAELVLQKYANRGKPIMVIHTNGGPYNSDNNYEANQLVSWSRDMPTPVIENIVNHFHKDYHIIQICKSKDNVIKGVEAIVNPQYNLELFSVLRVSEKRILIDSCLQHAAAAFNLPSTVLWNGTSPKVFGYDIHNNITPKRDYMEGFKNIKAYLHDFELWGDPVQCPYDTNDLYDIKKIIETT
jgi:hypothetical protein